MSQFFTSPNYGDIINYYIFFEKSLTNTGDFTLPCFSLHLGCSPSYTLRLRKLSRFHVFVVSDTWGCGVAILAMDVFHHGSKTYVYPKPNLRSESIRSSPHGSPRPFFRAHPLMAHNELLKVAVRCQPQRIWRI